MFLLLFAALGASSASGQIPPDEAWRTLETNHFRVTYPAGLLDLAQRAGHRAETAWDLLSEQFVEAPGGKVDLVVSDHADISNGFARVFPSNRIFIFAPPPVDGFGLAHMDEWMELVITHELVHIFHEDLARGLGGALRKVLGRFPAEWPFFPGSATPGWVVEGIATYYESSLTQAGRVKGSFHEMVVRTAILEDAFEPIDRASGDSQVWPGGQRYYIYGSLFLNHLLELHGQDAMSRFVEEVAGQWIPYRLNAAATAAFGVSFSDSWRAWEEELRTRYATLADSLAETAPITKGERLSDGGFYALNPGVSPSGTELAYSRQDGRSDTQLRLVNTTTLTSEKLARTNRLSNFSWTSDGGVLFSQTEYVDSYRVRGDLFLIDGNGTEQQVTRGARLDHPDANPAGGRTVAVQEGQGTNRLVWVDLQDGQIEPFTEFDPFVHWAYPRWSPNGEWIAVARWSSGARYDLVLLDRDGRVVREVTQDRAIDNSPTWSADGRWLLWASDRSGIPNIHGVSFDPTTGGVGPRKQVTNTLTGTAYPSVDPGGRWIYYSAYHSEGWFLERIPFEPETWFEPLPLHPTFLAQASRRRFQERSGAMEQPYKPLPTLRPTYWSPEIRAADEVDSRDVLEPGFGISTGGEDLVGRHAYSLRGTVSGGAGGFEGGGSYSFAGFGNPVLSVFANQFLDAEGPLSAPDESGDILYLVERERGVGASASFLRRRSRTFSSISLSGSHIWEDRTVLEENLKESRRFELERPDTRFAQGRASISLSTARSFPLSISPEDGAGIFLSGRMRRELGVADSLRDVPGADRSYRELVGQLTLFKGLELPGFGNHVLALRGSGGVASGPGADLSHFEVGGASGTGSPLSFVDLGGGLLFPVRGYSTASRFGRYAWSASAEYRFPIHLVNRGLGLFPFHLDWLSGALFFDAGNAWGPELGLRGYQNPRQDPLAAVGGEITARFLPLWYTPLDLRVGVAQPLVGGSGSSFYVRFGRPF